MKKNKYSELVLRFQTYNKKSSEKFKKAVSFIVRRNNLKLSSIDLPIERKRVTLVKSPHVNKKAKDQFETRLYNGIVIVKGHIFEDDILESINSIVSPDLLLKLTYKYNLC